jgi:NADH dehydrogenase (ubiquinone) 1 alpha subcomplex subunit 5
MRPAFRLFAAVRQSAPAPRTLVPNSPTGLTGLRTHPSPRSTLIYLYSNILHKVEQMPEHSVYRQATTALTKQRLAIVEAVKPPGYDAWSGRMTHELQELIEKMTEEERKELLQYDGKTFVKATMWKRPRDDREVEWDGEVMWSAIEGPRNEATAEKDMLAIDKKAELQKDISPSVEEEPLLSVEQIEKLEQEIGAGLIEEVIAVAENESICAAMILKEKAWEDLIEKAPEGQWSYFER